MASLKIDYYNVEISAVSDYSADPKKDAFYLLNDLCMMAAQAAAWADAEGYLALGKRYRRIVDQLFQACEDGGLYKEVVR